MARPFRRFVFAGIGLALLMLAGAMALPGGLELHITPVRGQAPLLVLPLEPGEPFTIHYYHSVENAPIWETHSLDPSGRIFIEEERYLKFGAGMGKMPGVGRMVRRGPYEVIEDMHMPTGDFVLRIGSPGVDHTGGLARYPDQPERVGTPCGGSVFGNTGVMVVSWVASGVPSQATPPPTPE
jgi:hypothetical protein